MTQQIDKQAPDEETREPISLTESRTSDQSENSPSTPTTSSDVESESGHDDDDQNDQREHEQAEQTDEPQVKCSAVHTLERDMPDYDYSHLVVQLRELILDEVSENEGIYSQGDIDKCRRDDWFLSRFLLRQKMVLADAFDMLKKAMRFNHESLANHLSANEFPAEFYQLAGIFPFGRDRKGNRMLYMRVRVHKKTPEISAIVQAFIYHNIKQLDEEAQGRGISLVIDCTGGGLANADMDTLLFIISTLKNYFPKGLSYFLVHEISWILKPFWHIAKAWVPDEHRQLIKFSDSRTINEFIEPAELPDFMGGLARSCDYKRVPENCVNLEQAAKLWGIEKGVMRRVFDKFKEHLPDETVARIELYLASGGGSSSLSGAPDEELQQKTSQLVCSSDESDDGLVADHDE